MQPQNHADLNLPPWGHGQNLKCLWILCWFLLQKWILTEKSSLMWQWEIREMTTLVCMCAQLQAVNMWLQIPYELIWTVFTRSMWLFISKPTLIHSCHFFIIKTFYLAFCVYNRVKCVQKMLGMESKRIFAKRETVDLSDQNTFVTNFLLFYVIPCSR